MIQFSFLQTAFFTSPSEYTTPGVPCSIPGEGFPSITTSSAVGYGPRRSPPKQHYIHGRIILDTSPLTDHAGHETADLVRDLEDVRDRRRVNQPVLGSNTANMQTDTRQARPAGKAPVQHALFPKVQRGDKLSTRRFIATVQIAPWK